ELERATIEKALIVAVRKALDAANRDACAIGAEIRLAIKVVQCEGPYRGTIDPAVEFVHRLLEFGIVRVLGMNEGTVVGQALRDAATIRLRNRLIWQGCHQPVVEARSVSASMSCGEPF